MPGTVEGRKDAETPHQGVVEGINMLPQPERLKEKVAGSGNRARSAAGSAIRGGSAGKADLSARNTDEQDEDLRLLHERATEAGLSEANRKKIVQSYIELCNVLPRTEARKIIIWKLLHENR
jgi:hypothetical protein